MLREIFPSVVFFSAIAVLAIVLLFTSSLSWPEWIMDLFPMLSDISLHIFLFFVISLLFLICWVFLFVAIARYYLDSWIVTNQRTIHTELKGLFNRVVSTVPHDKIQDITVEVRGILPTFFHYGDLHIQTAGGFRNFVFREIPEPNKTKDVIFKAQNEYLALKNYQNNASQQ